MAINDHKYQILAQPALECFLTASYILSWTPISLRELSNFTGVNGLNSSIAPVYNFLAELFQLGLNRLKETRQDNHSKELWRKIDLTEKHAAFLVRQDCIRSVSKYNEEHRQGAR